MRLSDTSQDEIVGADYSSLIGPGIDLVGNIFSSFGKGGSKPPPPPPPKEIPWIPISVVGTGLLILTTLIATKA